MAQSDAMNAIIERVLHGDATPADRERLDAWLGESLDNRARYAELVRLLKTARSLPAPAAARRVPAAAELLAGARPSSAEARTPSAALPNSGSGAPVGPSTEAAARRPAAAAPTGAPAGALRPVAGWRRGVRWLPWGIAAAAVLALVLTPIERVPAPARPTVVSTGPSELSTVHLEDGTVVRLGPSSELRVLAASAAREVALDGRAFFNVAEAAGRPFRVRTAHGQAEVLGTRFQLDARADDVRLVVVEGRVALSSDSDRVEVGGGETSGIVDGDVLEPRPLPGADSALRWTGTFLVFRATPLGVAVAEVARTYGIRITIADPAIANRTVTATFINRGPAEVLDVLCSVAAVRCDVRPGAAVISP